MPTCWGGRSQCTRPSKGRHSARPFWACWRPASAAADSGRPRRPCMAWPRAPAANRDTSCPTQRLTASMAVLTGTTASWPRRLTPYPPESPCTTSGVRHNRRDCPDFRVSENGTVPFAAVCVATAPRDTESVQSPIVGCGNSPKRLLVVRSHVCHIQNAGRNLHCRFPLLRPAAAKNMSSNPVPRPRTKFNVK